MEEKKLIEFRNIVKSFDSQVVLKGINLDIYENEFVNLDKTAVSYDDINNSKTILIIGDLYDENPLVARRVIMAKENGAKVICADNENKYTTSIDSDK